MFLFCPNLCFFPVHIRLCPHTDVKSLWGILIIMFVKFYTVYLFNLNKNILFVWKVFTFWKAKANHRSEFNQEWISIHQFCCQLIEMTTTISCLSSPLIVIESKMQLLSKWKLVIGWQFFIYLLSHIYRSLDKVYLDRRLLKPNFEFSLEMSNLGFAEP